MYLEHILYHIFVTDPSDNVSNTVFRNVIVEDNTRPIITVLDKNPRTAAVSYNDYTDLQTSIFDRR